MSAPTLPSMPATTAFDRRALADFRSLAGRIDGNGPRYTSYPTADRFEAEMDDARYLAALDACRADSPAPLSLYLHIPFCENICYYCGCNKIITKDHARSARYVDYLAREMAMVAGRPARGAPRGHAIALGRRHADLP